MNAVSDGRIRPRDMMYRNTLTNSAVLSGWRPYFRTPQGLAWCIYAVFNEDRVTVL